MLLTLVAPALAHHSPAAFERTKEVTLAGTVKEFRWQNPHTWIEVLVPNEKGQEVLWGVELTSPTYLVRAGWKSNTHQAWRQGDGRRQAAQIGRAGSAIFMSVTLADGRRCASGRRGSAGRQIRNDVEDCFHVSACYLARRCLTSVCH